MQKSNRKDAENSTPAAQARPWSQGKADRVIALIAILWGSSYLMMKVGLALLTVQSSFTLQSGDLLCIGGAAMYACQILLADHFTKDGNVLLLGIWQLGFCGLYAWLCAFLFETPVLPQSTAEWFAVLGLAVICSAFCFVALAVICSAFCFVAQPVAQKYTTPEHAALLFSLEPVSSAVFGFCFLHEVLSLRGYLGAVLVLCGVLIASVPQKEKDPAEAPDVL